MTSITLKLFSIEIVRHLVRSRRSPSEKDMDRFRPALQSPTLPQIVFTVVRNL